MKKNSSFLTKEEWNKIEQLYGAQKEWLCIENIASNLNISNELLQQANDENQEIVLFGVGIYGEIAMQYFKSCNVNVSYYCDNDINKHGKMIEGIPIISPQQLIGLKNPIIIITAKHFVREISEQLGELQLRHISFDAYFVEKMMSKYRFVYSNLLNDTRSQEIYIAVLKSMLFGVNKYCSSVMEENAFWAIPEFTNTGNEIFVDAGAYVGDTLEQFIWKNIGAFKKIYAFEPGERQYNAMQHRIKRLVQEWDIDEEKIISVKAGLGKTNSMLSYQYNSATPLGSNFISSNGTEAEQVKVYSLDNFIGSDPVTFIKSDIEGFEMEMLKGASNLIRRCRPKLAISIYHKPEDLFEIPILIHSLVPEYKMAVRHHASTLVDTVLYCWI